MADVNDADDSVGRVESDGEGSRDGFRCELS